MECEIDECLKMSEQIFKLIFCFNYPKKILVIKKLAIFYIKDQHSANFDRLFYAVRIFFENSLNYFSRAK